jgi:PHD/YefM family antitoxin component YafN of YafNO toxin-antitoxin module
MGSTVTISELQDRAPQVVKDAERNGSVAVSRQGRIIAFVVSRERMEAILETLEVMAQPELMKSIAEYESGKVKPRAFDPEKI